VAVTGVTVYTIGHSTRTADEFLNILKAFGIDLVADIRTIPRSRRNPQFERDVLSSALADQGIEYRHIGGLGGLRHPGKNSPNGGWRNNSFRGYADHMQTEEFAAALAELIVAAKEKTAAIMCAEAVPWRCHRSLVGDALVVRGIEVIDIISAVTSRAHRLTPWVRLEGLRITYPSSDVITAR
jgi:uncharacterized protein (DUF488 family)